MSASMPQVWLKTGEPVLSVSVIVLARACLGRMGTPPISRRKGTKGLGVEIETVTSSIFLTVGSCPSTSMVSRVSVGIFSLAMTSLKVKTTSSAVRGWPSDHWRPLRSLKV
ncbi:hypothetical protein D3C72_1823510 [compost metagenome]